MTEDELIEQAALRVGMKSLMNYGAGSCVYTEGCNGVSQEQLIAFAREVALYCVAALALPQPAAGQQALTDEQIAAALRATMPKTKCTAGYRAFARRIAALASQASEPEWMPIDSAPKDGTDVLVMYMHIDTQIVHNAFWMSEEDCWDGDNPVGWWTYTHSEVSRELLDDWRAPTHWMPLPSVKANAPKEGDHHD